MTSNQGRKQITLQKVVEVPVLAPVEETEIPMIVSEGLKNVYWASESGTKHDDWAKLQNEIYPQPKKMKIIYCQPGETS